MISLIKSATLYNAAIARSPDNVDVIKNDLKQLCNKVLRIAKAKDLNADLIKISKQVKQDIITMRLNVEKKTLCTQKLNTSTKTFRNQFNLESDKIKTVKNLQQQITTDYTNIMANLAKYCENVMGEAPCQFTIVGMRSLARKEITPYSDFEHIIVLEEISQQKANDQKLLDYFRWFSIIFQIVLINLEETILPSVAVESLNNHSKYGNWFFDSITTRGISFDGMLPHACKFLLGRQQLTKNKKWKTELIKTISEMLKYLTTDKDLKKGYERYSHQNLLCLWK